MVEPVSLALSFVGGIASHIIAIYGYERAKHYKHRGNLKLEGTWAEKIERRENSYSLCKIFYDVKKGMYAFDGTNYKNNGDINGHFSTVASVLSDDKRRLFYIYEVEFLADPGAQIHGLGILNLHEQGGIVRPSDGHFNAGKPDKGEATPYSVYVTDLPYDRNAKGHKVIEFLKDK